jgi:hypothetical protein
VREDFLGMPLGSQELWLHNIYVMMEESDSQESATMLLQTDGYVWISNSVFQGRSLGSQSPCRAIDVNTDDGGSPRMYAESALPAFIGRKRMSKSRECELKGQWSQAPQLSRNAPQ